MFKRYIIKLIAGIFFTVIIITGCALTTPQHNAKTAVPVADTTTDPALNLKAPANLKLLQDRDGTSVWAMGVLVTLKLQSKDAGGTYAMFEDYIPPGVGTPLHVHSREEEFWYMLDGELNWYVGNKQFQAKKGDFINTPRGVPHRFKNASNKPARMFLGYSPGGFEQWFLDVGKPVRNLQEAPPKVTPDDIQQAIKAAKNYGVEFMKQ
jgi:quercetin dioxygenase-like cupin family protein